MILHHSQACLSRQVTQFFVFYHAGLVDSGSLIPAPEPETPKIPMVIFCRDHESFLLQFSLFNALP